LRGQLLLSCGYEPEQPGVLVRLWVNSDDLRSVDVEAFEDLSERLFSKPVRNGWVPPERPELRQHLTGAPEAHLVGSMLSHSPRVIQSTPGPAECLDGDLAALELALEPLSGSLDIGRVWVGGGHRLASHRTQDLADIRLVKGDAVEELRNLLLISLGAIGGRWAASWATRVPDPAVTIAGVTMERAPAGPAALAIVDFVFLRGMPRPTSL
jgi:hypothetical protein